MVFIVKKLDRKTYQVKNKFNGAVKAVRTSYAAAQEVANDLNRQQASTGAEYVSSPRSPAE